MIPITVLVREAESAPRVRDRLRERGVPCVLLADDGPVADDEVLRGACEALAAVGISAVIQAGPARAATLATDLARGLPRVLLAAASAADTLDDCQRRQWIPAQGESYTPDELAAVTARLQDMGYA